MALSCAPRLTGPGVPPSAPATFPAPRVTPQRLLDARPDVSRIPPDGERPEEIASPPVLPVADRETPAIPAIRRSYSCCA